MPEKEKIETFEDFEYVEKTFLDFSDPVRFQMRTIPIRGINSFGRPCWTADVVNVDTDQELNIDMSNRLLGSIKKALMGSDPLRVVFNVTRVGEGFDVAYEVEVEKETALQSRI